MAVDAVKDDTLDGPTKVGTAQEAVGPRGA